MSVTTTVVAGATPATTSTHRDADREFTGSETDGAEKTAERAMDSFADLYRQLWPSVVRSLRAIGHAGMDAEDIADMAFMKLYEQMLTGCVPAHPRGWLITVARRQALRYSSLSRKPGIEILMPPEDLVNIAGTTADASVAAEMALERVEIIRCIENLPNGYQEVLALLLDGYKLSEIAPELGIARSLARRRLEQAQEILRKRVLDSGKREGKRMTALPAVQPVSPHPRARDAQPTASEIEQATNLLPPRQKEIMRWSREGYKPGQIAKVLGISANTVRVNLCHARKRLRRDLEQRSPEREAHLLQQSGRA